jgi:SPP1 family predicted phage head-tail adaptor
MNYDTVVKLIKREKSGKDEYGNAVFSEHETVVFAEKKAVKQSEFFQAHAAGFKPEIVIVVHGFEFHNEEICELDGERFKIYRSYPIGKTDRIELYLTAIVGDTDVYT